MIAMPPWLLDRFRLSRRAYFADFWITPPITLVLAIMSFRRDAFGPWLVLILAGWALWTLYEYVLHRFALHHLAFFRDLHGLHHANDRDYIALHPAATLIIYAMFWLIFGLQASALMVGFSLGYIVYSSLHTAFHYAKIGPGHFLYPAKFRHARHHTFNDLNFGVTTGFWDRLFGTKDWRL